MSPLQAAQVNAGALYTAIEFAAVFASAISGLIEARQRRQPGTPGSRLHTA